MSARVGSVVIPAHDEESSIASTLAALEDGVAHEALDVVVVCNGCRDATAAVARSFPWATVVEIDEASKVAALRAGDRAVTTFPRIYLDGDIALSGHAARALVQRLAVAEPRVAGVRGRYDLGSATQLVRWYYSFRQDLPVFRHGIIGAGVYAMNEAGRSRFGEWPDVLGDDQFVLRSFAPEERMLVTEHHTTVRVAPDLRSVIRRGLRVRRGNRTLTLGPGAPTFPPPPTGVTQGLRESLGHPHRWPAAATWLSVTVAIRLLERFGVGGDWGRGDPR